MAARRPRADSDADVDIDVDVVIEVDIDVHPDTGVDVNVDIVVELLSGLLQNTPRLLTRNCRTIVYFQFVTSAESDKKRAFVSFY